MTLRRSSTFSRAWTGRAQARRLMSGGGLPGAMLWSRSPVLFACEEHIQMKTLDSKRTVRNLVIFIAAVLGSAALASLVERVTAPPGSIR